MWFNFCVIFFMVGDCMFVFGDFCDYFFLGKLKVFILFMFIFVVIEMFNVLNVFLENNSLLIMFGWVNRYLLVVIVVFMGLYFVILYILWLVDLFGVVLLNLNEWLLVVVIFFLIILLDELFKVIG